MRILAIETSCDETAAAIVEDDKSILSNIVASSQSLQKKWGGVVPEIAAREQVKCITPVLDNALEKANIKKPEKEIDAIAVTIGPGLIGSLLVGVETAKTLALVWNKPVIPVNHVHGHIYANFVNQHYPNPSSSQQNKSFETIPEIKKKPKGTSSYMSKLAINFPAIALVASGGHTELFLMRNKKSLQWLGGTIDDAAGEAFDKTARLLGFENKGGPALEQAAKNHEPPVNNASQSNIDKQTMLSKKQSALGKKHKLNLPRPILHDSSFNFSFSGLKTAVLRKWQKHKNHSKKLINEFAFEIQESITDVLVAKTIRAAKQYNTRSILIAGGVAANTRLREKFNYRLQTMNHKLFMPPRKLCTDNAVMIAIYAHFHHNFKDWEKIMAIPDLSVEKIDNPKVT